MQQGSDSQQGEVLCSQPLSDPWMVQKPLKRCFRCDTGSNGSTLGSVVLCRHSGICAESKQETMTMETALESLSP